MRRSAFPLDEPLDAAGTAAASALVGQLGRGEALTSPALRARATAEAAGLDAAKISVLSECDFGTWAGRTLADVWESEPAAAEAWMTDPAAAPHGGESLAAFLERVGTWLDEQVTREGRAVAVTHGGVVRAAVVHALGADPHAFWRVDSSPLHATELHGREGLWTLARVNAPVALEMAVPDRVEAA
ncbi:MAG: histidine phosphatase family protein [Solirubrobacteraceae bacterium]